MFSLKLLLISVGIIAVASTTKLAAPVMFNFVLNDLPAIWSVIVSWLQPPYVYVLVNGIIILIVACTRFQSKHNQEINQFQQHVNFNSSIHLSFGTPVTNYDVRPSVFVEPMMVYESTRAFVDMHADPVLMDGADIVGGIKDEFITTKSWSQPQSVVECPLSPKKVHPEFILPVKEKKLVRSRFIHNRKPARNTPDGTRALRVLKPKKYETLDSTWKMITEKKFQKSETFENIHYDCPLETTNKKVMRKSDTFKDRTGYQNQNTLLKSSFPDSAGKLKKELSLSQDELNRRVEAFIKKFNDNMRLQRQQYP